jgi:two-component system chemotaxis response regulator CheY
MNPNLLIVDDSATIRQQVSDALSPHGFHVEEASDGNLGLARIKNGGIDCVICDINMPNMNGIEMVAEVKQLPEFAELPIIMLTTEAARELIQKAKSAGASGWIVKPFKIDLLLAAVRKLTPIVRV